ncbi:MAG TPA: hypothetical protein DCQ87_07185 [Lachnospiraceae bacterium]|nr:hypothetical protein [Lachnospiraceae bacterium]
MAAAKEVRLGKVGKVNTKTGMITVVFSDRGDESTDEIPMLAPAGGWKKPDIGELVLVNYLSNGSSVAVALSTLWNGQLNPIQGALWCMLFTHSDSKNYMSFDEKTETFTVNAPNAKFDVKKHFTISDYMSFDEKTKTLTINTDNVKINAKNITCDANGGLTVSANDITQKADSYTVNSRSESHTSNGTYSVSAGSISHTTGGSCTVSAGTESHTAGTFNVSAGNVTI